MTDCAEYSTGANGAASRKVVGARAPSGTRRRLSRRPGIAQAVGLIFLLASTTSALPSPVPTPKPTHMLAPLPVTLPKPEMLTNGSLTNGNGTTKQSPTPTMLTNGYSYSYSFSYSSTTLLLTPVILKPTALPSSLPSPTLSTPLPSQSPSKAPTQFPSEAPNPAPSGWPSKHGDDALWSVYFPRTKPTVSKQGTTKKKHRACDSSCCQCGNPCFALGFSYFFFVL